MSDEAQQHELPHAKTVETQKHPLDSYKNVKKGLVTEEDWREAARVQKKHKRQRATSDE